MLQRGDNGDGMCLGMITYDLFVVCLIRVQCCAFVSDASGVLIEGAIAGISLFILLVLRYVVIM